MPSTNRIELLERIRVLRVLLRSGYSRQNIIDKYTSGEIYDDFQFQPAKKKKLSKRQCDREIAMVLKRWQKAYTEHLEDDNYHLAEMTLYIEELSQLKREASKDRQLGVSLAISRELAEIKGLKSDNRLSGGNVRIYISGVPEIQIEGQAAQLEESKRLLKEKDKTEIIIDAEIVDEETKDE